MQEYTFPGLRKNSAFRKKGNAVAEIMAGTANAEWEEFQKLFSLRNLERAYFKAREAKQQRYEVLIFTRDLYYNLRRIQRDVLGGHYVFGPYREFTVFDSKRRHIVASPFRDRIIHWVIYEYLYPIFENSFIFDSFGNRRGMGTAAGVRRARKFVQKPDARYVLQMDFSKYFYSIHHKVLLQQISHKVHNPYLMYLLWRLVTSYKTPAIWDNLFEEYSMYRLTTKKGMPIGSLLSQLFANVYLNGLDHFCKDYLRIKYYIRYVDDIVIFGPDKEYLHILFLAIHNYCYERLGLELHPRKTRLFPLSQGVDFLGYRISPYQILIRKRTQHKARRALIMRAKTQMAGYYGVAVQSDSHLREIIHLSIG